MAQPYPEGFSTRTSDSTAERATAPPARRKVRCMTMHVRVMPGRLQVGGSKADDLSHSEKLGTRGVTGHAQNIRKQKTFFSTLVLKYWLNVTTCFSIPDKTFIYRFTLFQMVMRTAGWTRPHRPKTMWRRREAGTLFLFEAGTVFRVLGKQAHCTEEKQTHYPEEYHWPKKKETHCPGEKQIRCTEEKQANGPVEKHHRWA